MAGFLVLILGAALAAAAPAAAVGDPTRPGSRVTHGPSCRPGGLVVEVVAGTVPYAVRLATTRAPQGEDEAVLQPGEAVVLRSDDVDWGETIDGRLEYTAGDGSGLAYTDELDEYTFTRPTREDCAAAAAPTTPEPVPPPAAATGAATGSAEPAPAESAPPAPSGADRSPGAAVPAPADRTSGAPGREVAAGGTVVLAADGYVPGERVTIRLREGGNVLGTATAGPDGSVAAEVRIPQEAAGRTTVDLVGTESAVVAEVDLRVAGAAREGTASGWTDLAPLTAAAVALVGTAAALVSVTGSRRTALRRHAPSGSA